LGQIPSNPATTAEDAHNMAKRDMNERRLPARGILREAFRKAAWGTRYDDDSAEARTRATKTNYGQTAQY